MFEDLIGKKVLKLGGVSLDGLTVAELNKKIKDAGKTMVLQMFEFPSKKEQEPNTVFVFVDKATVIRKIVEK